MTKRVVKKTAARKPMDDLPGFDPNRLRDPDKTRKVIARQEKPSFKRVAKVVSLHISTGDEDRDRSIEEMIAEVLRRIDTVPFGEPGMHATTMGSYYIIDGVVYLPADYDPKNGIRKGAFPPPWAGGPPPVHTPTVTQLSGGINDRHTLSAAEYDEKYKGKRPPGFIPDTSNVHTRNAKSKAHPEDEGLEEPAWGSKDVGDDEQAKEVASARLKKAVKTLRIKKTPAPPKRTIRINKKAGK